MLSFPAAIKVYLCTLPYDMRCHAQRLSMTGVHMIRWKPSREGKGDGRI